MWWKDMVIQCSCCRKHGLEVLESLESNKLGPTVLGRLQSLKGLYLTY